MVITLHLAVLASRAARRARVVQRAAGAALVATVLVQALLGMLTVTWQLKPLIVTLHLLFGMTTLALLWWLSLSLPRSSGAAPRCTARAAPSAAGAPRRWRTLASWRSSDLARCCCRSRSAAGPAATTPPSPARTSPPARASWWPHANFRQAFVLWHGLNIDYEGGVLDNPARVAIHLTHRLGALIAAIVLGLAALYVLRRRGFAGARPWAWAVLAALALQLAIGVSMVLKGFPLWLATAHTAGAALLLLATLALLRSLSAR